MPTKPHSWTRKIALIAITSFIALGFTCGNTFAHHNTSSTEVHHEREITEAHAEDSYNSDSNHCCSLTDANKAIAEEITIPVIGSGLDTGLTATIPAILTQIVGEDHPPTAPPLYKQPPLHPYSSSSFLASVRSVKRLN